MNPPILIWSPSYEVDIGAHVFPTRKYRLVRDRLLAHGVVGEDAFLEPEAVDDAVLGRIHTAEYLRKIREDDFAPGERWQLEVPFSRELEAAMRLCCGGTILACRRAVEGRAVGPGGRGDGSGGGDDGGGGGDDGGGGGARRPGAGDDGGGAAAEAPDGRGAAGSPVAVHLGGGFHHAFPGHGEGFCLLNDVAVAPAELLASGDVERLAVVDLDVHHGNGTAAALAGEERAFTFSMHQERNYPAVKPPSDLDVGLDDGTDDATYLALLDEHLETVLGTGPELVLYLAGADPYREDQLGGLGLTREGLRERDRRVLRRSLDAGAGVAVVLAGGYAVNESDTVAIHAATCEEALEAAR